MIGISSPHVSLNDLNKGCVCFDGVNDYMDIGSTPDIEFDNDNKFSFMFWLRPQSTGVDKIIGFRINTGDTQGIEIAWVNGKWQFILTGDNSPLNQIYVETTETFLSNLWYNLTFTYDGSEKAAGTRIYVNGVNKSLNVIRDNLTKSFLYTGSKKVGSNFANTMPFYGKIDRLGIFDKILTQDDISWIYAWRNLKDLAYLNCIQNLLHFWCLGHDATTLVVPDMITSLDGTLTNMSASSNEIDRA